MSDDPAPPRERPSWGLALALALLFVLLGGTQLDRYGVTWDEALGDFFFGERYLSYFLSFDARYLDFEADPYPEGHVPDLRASPFRVRPWEYYPLANILAAATSRVTSAAGLFDPLDGFHAVNLWLGAGFLVLLFVFAEMRWGLAPALLASVGLLSMPRVVCHALANIKDFPEMVLFSAALLAFVTAWEKGSVRGVLGAGALTGLALAAKANALFLAPIYLLCLIVGGLPNVWEGRFRELAAAGLGAAALGVALPVALWPYLWPDPIGRIGEHLSYVSGQVFQVREESLLSPLQALLFTTPPLMLLAGAIGLIPLAQALRRRDRLAALLFSWTLVTLGRMYLPGAVNFDGIRHFLELLPALTLLAAWGAFWLQERVPRAWGVPLLVGLVISGSL
ncbi:MAG: glycosyltransferase family 39 protein, partial [Acidobacteriota bacterium]